MKIAAAEIAEANARERFTRIVARVTPSAELAREWVAAVEALTEAKIKLALAQNERDRAGQGCHIAQHALRPLSAVGQPEVAA